MCYESRSVFYNPKIIFLSVILLSGIVNSYAQNYNFRNFSMEDGLAQSQVLSMCQDKNGNIWFGTNNGGASIYDGNKFSSFDENDSLISNVVYSITELKNGSLLFGTAEGLGVLFEKKVSNYTHKNGLPHNRVFKTIQDNMGIVWVGTGKGVCQLSGNKIIPFSCDTLLNKANIFTMYADKVNNIWFGTMEYGLIKYNLSSKKFNYFNDSNGLHSNFIRAINEDFQGNIYVGTNSGINKITPTGTIEKLAIKGVENFSFTAIIQDNKKNLWLTTTAGVYKYNDNACKFFSEKNGLSGNHIYCALKDREGNLWFGIHGFGVSKFSGEAFTSFTTKDSLPGDYINSIFQDSQKNIWLGVKEFGVCRIKNNKIINYKPDVKNQKNTLVDSEIQAIKEDNQGNIYFGSLHGLSIFNGKSFHNFYESDGLPDQSIYAIAKDYRGDMWIGTANGLCVIRNNKIKIEVIDVAKKLKIEKCEIPVYSVFEDRSHTIWLATEDGVLKYNREAFVKYNKNSGFTDKRVISIAQDANGNLWFGTDEGVFRYDHTNFKKINQNNGLAANNVYFILFDYANNLWVATTKGIDRINVRIYNLSNKVEIRHFDNEDGLKDMECNRNAMLKDRNENLWFGTIKGVTVYNPHFAKINHKEPITRITGLRLFFQNAENELRNYSKGTNNYSGLPLNVCLPSDKNHITFDFVSVCLTDPSKVKYQFKLDGIDNDWFPPTSKTEATYSSLPSGEYTFHLKAMNNDGLWNKKDVTYSFIILPPWYKTWWFRSFEGLFIIGSVVGFFNYRTATLRQRQRQLEQTVLLRTAEVISQKEEAEKQKEKIIDSIIYAKRIQQSILMEESEIQNYLPDSFIYYQPKDIVSGDFYWCSKIEDKIILAAIDCTGHGVPGAFMSMIGNTLLNQIVNEKHITIPSEILRLLNLGVFEALHQNKDGALSDDGMDISLCAFDFKKNELQFAGAQNPLFLVSDNRIEIIKGNIHGVGGGGMTAKILDPMKTTYTNHIVPIKKNMSIYLFSDGYMDQFGGSERKKFGVQKFKELLLNNQELSMQKQKEIFMSAHAQWKGKATQIDDILMIGVKLSCP